MIKVKLESISRKNGNTPEDKERVGKEFLVYSLQIGIPAMFIYEDSDWCLRTSRVEDVYIHEKTMYVRTRNTEYEFTILGGKK